MGMPPEMGMYKQLGATYGGGAYGGELVPPPSPRAPCMFGRGCTNLECLFAHPFPGGSIMADNEKKARDAARARANAVASSMGQRQEAWYAVERAAAEGGARLKNLLQGGADEGGNVPR
jgi:hypothetical protein